MPDPCVSALPGGRVRFRARSPLGRTNLSWKLDQTVETVNRALVGARVKLLPGAVFQSTYFTMLPPGWPQVAIAHDFNHELFPEAYGQFWSVAARHLPSLPPSRTAHRCRLGGHQATRDSVLRN